MQNNHNCAHQPKDEWFYFMNDEVVGPATYRSLFFLPAIGQNGTPIMVRKKGFKKWYPIAELPGFEGAPPKNLLDYQVDEERRAFSAFFTEKMQELSMLHQLTLSQYDNLDTSQYPGMTQQTINENPRPPRDNIVTRSFQHIKKPSPESDAQEPPETPAEIATIAAVKSDEKNESTLAESFNPPVISTQEISNIKIDPEPIIEEQLSMTAPQSPESSVEISQNQPKKHSIMRKMIGLWRSRPVHRESQP